jgi:hypothetical protein
MDLTTGWLINSEAFSPQAIPIKRILVPTFVDRAVSRGQIGGTPTAVNLSFQDRSHYFSFQVAHLSQVG